MGGFHALNLIIPRMDGLCRFRPSRKSCIGIKLGKEADACHEQAEQAKDARFASQFSHGSLDTNVARYSAVVNGRSLALCVHAVMAETNKRNPEECLDVANDLYAN